MDFVKIALISAALAAIAIMIVISMWTSGGAMNGLLVAVLAVPFFSAVGFLSSIGALMRERNARTYVAFALTGALVAICVAVTVELQSFSFR